MIDTIVFTLSKDRYQIIQPNRFQPSAKLLLSEHSHAIQAKQNPTRKELLKGEYKPRLTLQKRMNSGGQFDLVLKVELSLSKLLFGNNVDELCYKDFAAVIKKLVVVLQAMGVETTAEMLANAPVSSIHYSKNIPLTDGSTPYHLSTKLKKQISKFLLIPIKLIIAMMAIVINGIAILMKLFSMIRFLIWRKQRRAAKERLIKIVHYIIRCFPFSGEEKNLKFCAWKCD